jgi:acetyl-CoA acetyltransferase family protein
MTAPAVWILGGIRTPFAPAGGALARMSVVELARLAMAEVMARHEFDPDRLDEVILGNCAQPSEAANPARVAALRAGVPDQVPAATVNRNCASGMEALAVAAERIRLGRARLVLAGGAEAMSAIPLLLPDAFAAWQRDLARARDPFGRARAALRFRPSMLRPRVALREALRDPVSGLDMGQTAEVLARDFRIARERQDEFALRSHRRAVAARERLRGEIVPVFPPGAAAPLTDDAGPREDTSLEALARLRPVFEPRDGTVTAGNSCPVSDGAVALLLGDERSAAAWRVPPLGRLRAWSVAALAPARMGLGPVHALAALLRDEDLALADLDLVELHEAFAAQALAGLEALRSDAFCRDELHLERALGAVDEERLNVNGGAIALGHPVGASGARLPLTLLHEMRRRGARLGLAALCVGGGQGMALLLEAA